MAGVGRMGHDSEGPWLRRLLDIGYTLTTELDQRVVLDRVLETAREITGARYAAVGILNEQRTELAQFLTSGVDEATHRAIGDLPTRAGCPGGADRAGRSRCASVTWASTRPATASP